MKQFATAIALLLFIAGSPALAAWSTFKDPNGNFTFESNTKVVVTNSQGVSRSGKVIPSISYDAEEGPLSVGVYEGQIDVDPQIAKAFSKPQLLDLEAEMTQRGMGAKALSIEHEMLDGEEGRRMELIAQDGSRWMWRTFVFRGRMYSAYSAYKPDASDALKADAARFHKSFHLTAPH